ncbi:hypothetical protein EXS73_01980 [Candidatus Pacearchaeota archaeon]|nr:hypothetical protein [Candidatus Pacearchaeota archaeon]
MKRVVVCCFFLLISLVSLSSVSAAPDIRELSGSVAKAFVDIGEPLLQALFGHEWSGQLLFERFLLALVLVVLIYLILGKVPLFEGDGQQRIRMCIALIVPLIGMRYLDYAWLTSVLQQYALLALVLLALLPFLLYFYFLYEIAGDHGIIRKLGWLLFIALYAGLWSTAPTDRADIYLWTTVLAFVCLLGDNLIFSRYELRKLMKADRRFKGREIARLRDEIHEIEGQIARASIDEREGRKMISDLQKHIHWLQKQYVTS